MKSLTAFALALAAGSAVAQSAPPSDVPRDHWAFPAVENLYRLGILKGYPDGSFKGSRPVSRFELAGTINALFTDARNQSDGVLRQLESERQSMTGSPVAELARLRRELDALRADVTGLNNLRPEVDSLSRDFGNLSDQLRRLRGDLEGMRGTLNRTKG